MRKIKSKRTLRNVSEYRNKIDLQNVAFIIKRGKIGMYMKELLHDTRNLMYPFTAVKLKEQKKNSIKDFLSAAGIFGVSHMMMFT